MSHWNYRVMKHTHNNEDHYEIHEVYYDNDDIVKTWTDNGARPFGETIDELKKDMAAMAEAFNKPILDGNTGKEE